MQSHSFCTNLCLTCVMGAGVRWTPLQSRSADRGDSRDGGVGIRLGGVVTSRILNVRKYHSVVHTHAGSHLFANAKEGSLICYSPEKVDYPSCGFLCLLGIAEGGKAEIALAAFSEAHARCSDYLLFI